MTINKLKVLENMTGCDDQELNMNLKNMNFMLRFSKDSFLIIDLIKACTQREPAILHYAFHSTRNYYFVSAVCTLSVPPQEESLACHSH